MVGHLISEIHWNLQSGVRDLPPLDKSAAMADLLPNGFIWALTVRIWIKPCRAELVQWRTKLYATGQVPGLRAEAIVFVMPGSSWRKNHYIRAALELLVLKPFYSYCLEDQAYGRPKKSS